MHKALNVTLAALPDDTKVFVSYPFPQSHADCGVDESQPGHEYTKSNVRFGLSVLQSEAVKALDAFADANKETQGKFTIGDEKKHNVFMRPQVSSAWFGVWGVGLGADDEVGPRDPKGYGGDGSRCDYDQVEGDEE